MDECPDGWTRTREDGWDVFRCHRHRMTVSLNVEPDPRYPDEIGMIDAERAFWASPRAANEAAQAFAELMQWLVRQVGQDGRGR